MTSLAGFSFLVFLAVTLFHLSWMLVGIGLLHRLIHRCISRPDQRYFVSLLSLGGLIVAIPAACFLAMNAQHQRQSIMNAQETVLDATPVGSIAFDAVARPRAVTFENGSRDLESKLRVPTIGPAQAADGQAVTEGFHASAEVQPDQSQLQRLVAMAAMAAIPVSICYLLGVTIMLIRFCSMLVGFHRLTRNAVPVENKNYLRIIKELANDCGLRAPPALLTSGKIVVPLASGIWQNSILIPTSMLTGLSVHEIRCILAHELAHLRRQDSLVLLLQRLVETLLFFHPATWWISRDLSNDREYCCDKLVINAGICPIEYSQTLCKVAELTRQQLLTGNKLSMAVSGDSSTELVNRIRILVQPNIPSTSMSVSARTALPIVFISAVALVASLWGGSDRYNILQEQDGDSVAPPAASPVNEDQFFTVRLLTPDGQDAKDAKVELIYWNRSGQTVFSEPDRSSGGSFQFFRKFATAYDRIILNAADTASGSALSKSFPKEDFAQLFDRKTEFRLQACTSVTGTVLDFESGNPIVGAEVKFLGKLKGVANMQPFDVVKSDESGRFSIPMVLPGTSGYLTAKHERYLHARLLPDRIEIRPETEYDIALSAGVASPNAKIQPVKVPEVADMSPQDAIETLSSKYKEDLATSRQLVNQAKTLAERQLIWHRTIPNQPYQDAMVAVADANRGTEFEAQALAWACNVHQHSEEQNARKRRATRKKIADRLLKDHIDSPHLSLCLEHLVYTQDDAIETAARILKANPDQTVQGNCLLLMAKRELDKREIELKYRSIDNRKRISDDQLATCKRNAIQYMTQIVNSYSHIPYWRDETLGNYARNQLAKLQRFSVGSMAPEISGQDQNGDPMTLSQFRGRYVVLDFWGSWCGPCIGDLPELNELSKLQDGKVVVLGVMNDARQDALNTIEKHGVTWRNWIDDRKAKDSITNQWQIDSWPSTFVIDPKGVIRSTGLAKVVGAKNFHLLVERIMREDRKQQAIQKKFRFEFREHRSDYEDGLRIAKELIEQAEVENAPPKIIAKLYYDASQCARFLQLNHRDESQRTSMAKPIALLKNVTDDADRFVENYDTAVWYTNCVGLLAAIMQDAEAPVKELEAVLEQALSLVDRSRTMNAKERLLLECDIRMDLADISIDTEDWKKAVQFMQPIFERPDVLLTDARSAYRLAMGTRQQSMFLSEAGDHKSCVQLIDRMCEQFESAELLSESVRLSNQCMLRGKQLVNYGDGKRPVTLRNAMRNYQALATRAESFQGPGRPDVLKSCINMHRLASARKDITKEEARQLITRVMELIESEKGIRQGRSSVFWDLNDIIRMTAPVFEPEEVQGFKESIKRLKQKTMEKNLTAVERNIVQ